ncbi:hypothetical protein [Rhodoferax mekongensis]|uniref:hypothetical protein n=1 Tax=Rhodoferax mekongensis TaxID=3068341 RepID=UPI0028BD30C4|nr:hypothetical protein [Rhodoferax sp. TBRC 17199]MDT7515384.1 hypothetical protein [Rhodoferax sp. TBRC 17199]
MKHLDLDIVIVGMDILLLIMAFYMAYLSFSIEIKGAVGKVVTNLVIGSIVFGFAHLLETAFHHFSLASEDANEIIHRSIILISLIFFLRGVMKLHSVFAKNE